MGLVASKFAQRKDCLLFLTSLSHMLLFVASSEMEMKVYPHMMSYWISSQVSLRIDYSVYCLSARPFLICQSLSIVESDGMSGASLAGVARAAASRALERSVTSFAGHVASGSDLSGMGEGISISDCLVTQTDIEKAVEDVFESAKGGDYTEIEDSASDESAGNDKSKPADEDANTNQAPTL